MSTPEPRFEVPPEYAEVYERAYRTAYEGIDVEPASSRSDPGGAPAFVVPAQRGSGGRRAAVPGQRRAAGSSGYASRSAPRGGARRSGRPSDRSSVATRPQPRPDADDVVSTDVTRLEPPTPAAPVPAGRRRSHRAVPRTGSTWFPTLGLLALALILIAGSFVLGRVTADTTATSEPARRRDASHAYAGPLSPLRPLTAAAGCTSAPGLSPQGTPVGYDATNLLDDDPATAWRCDGDAIGQVLELTLPRGSRVAAVGLVPGYAATDPTTGADLYAANDRVTRVSWSLGGRTLDQDIASGAQDRSVRVLRIPVTRTDRIQVRIDAVDLGPTGATMLSSLVVEQPVP